MARVPARPEGPVGRADIEAKLQEIRGEVEQTSNQAKPYALAAAVAVGVAVVALAYVMGRRKGRKKTTVVEVRRV